VVTGAPPPTKNPILTCVVELKYKHRAGGIDLVPGSISCIPYRKFVIK
jgi:hypothetical protein